MKPFSKDLKTLRKFFEVMGYYPFFASIFAWVFRIFSPLFRRYYLIPLAERANQVEVEQKMAQACKLSPDMEKLCQWLQRQSTGLTSAQMMMALKFQNKVGRSLADAFAIAGMLLSIFKNCNLPADDFMKVMTIGNGTQYAVAPDQAGFNRTETYEVWETLPPTQKMQLLMLEDDKKSSVLFELFFDNETRKKLAPIIYGLPVDDQMDLLSLGDGTEYSVISNLSIYDSVGILNHLESGIFTDEQIAQLLRAGEGRPDGTVAHCLSRRVPREYAQLKDRLTDSLKADLP
jgi:hypothetical protein